MWLSLMITESSSPKRWFDPPPQRTAYFSSARSPGVVLRVQMIRARESLTSRTKVRVRVAIPHRRASRLIAVRSALSNDLARPWTSSSTSPASASSQSATRWLISALGSSRRKAMAATGPPEIRHGSRAMIRALALRSCSTTASEVTSPARPRSSSRAWRSRSSKRSWWSSGRIGLAMFSPFTRQARRSPDIRFGCAHPRLSSASVRGAAGPQKIDPDSSAG